MQVTFSAPSLAPSPFAGAAPVDQNLGTAGDSFASLLDSKGGRPPSSAEAPSAAEVVSAGEASVVPELVAEGAPVADELELDAESDAESLFPEGGEELPDGSRPGGVSASSGQRVLPPASLPMPLLPPGSESGEPAATQESRPDETLADETPGNSNSARAVGVSIQAAESPVPGSPGQGSGREAASGGTAPASSVGKTPAVGTKTSEVAQAFSAPPPGSQTHTVPGESRTPSGAPASGPAAAAVARQRSTDTPPPPVGLAPVQVAGGANPGLAAAVESVPSSVSVGPGEVTADTNVGLAATAVLSGVPASAEVASTHHESKTAARRVIEQARTSGVQITSQKTSVASPDAAGTPAGTANNTTLADAGRRPLVHLQTLTQMLVETAAVTVARPTQSAAGKLTSGGVVPFAATAIAEATPPVSGVAMTSAPAVLGGTPVVAVPSGATEPQAPSVPAVAVQNTKAVPTMTKAEIVASVVGANEQPADVSVRGLREILAGNAGKTGRSETDFRKESAVQNFQTVDKQRVGGHGVEFGTRGANATQTMTASAPVPLPADAAPDAFEPQSVSAQALSPASGTTALKQAPDVVAPQRSFAAAAVREIMDVAEKAHETGRTHVELKLETKDNESLRIHLNWRDGVVHAKFVTQTAELQRALSREWDEAAPRFAERGLKFSEPSFERNGQQPDQQAGQQPGQSAFSSGQQRQYSHGRFAEADNLLGFALPGAASKAATADTRLPIATQTIPSPVLADARGLRVWA